MKRLLPGCITALFATALLWGAWAHYPTSQFPQEIADIVTRQQMLEKQKQAHRQEVPEATWPEFEMLALGSQEAYRNSHLRQLIGEKDPKVPDTVARYSAAYRSTHELLTGDTLLTGGSSRLGSLEATLSAYAEVLIAEGQFEPAQGAVLDTLRLSQHVGERNSIYGLATRTTVQARALGTSEFALSHSPWTARGLRDLAALLESSNLPGDAMTQALEGELALCDGLEGEEYTRSRLLNFSFPPARVQPLGWLNRQTRLFQNQTLELLHSLKSGIALPQSPKEDEPFQWDQWAFGSVTDPRLTYMSEFQRRCGFLRTRQGLDHLWVYLLLHQLQFGQWPQDLAALKAVDYRPLDGFDAERAGWQVNAGGGLQLSYRLSENFRRSESNFGLLWPRIWIETENSLEMTSPIPKP